MATLKLTIPGDIADLAGMYGDRILIGTGTVTEVEQIAAVAHAQGRFVISPDPYLDVIASARAHGLEPIPGMLTPTVVRVAGRADAKLINLFLVSLGGPDYLKQIRAPRHDTHVIPAGRVTLTNVTSCFEAGAAAVAVGRNLVPKEFDGSADAVAALTFRAEEFMRLAKNADT